MANEVAAARKALGRGRPDESLVYLWNALEPARLAGDRRALERIGELAERIRAESESVERREAERLLEALHEGAEAEAPVMVARAGQEAEVPLGAESAPGPEEFAADEEPAEAEAAQTRASRAGSLIFLLIFLAVIALNILRAIQDAE